MKESYVSFEIAKRLKECCFNWETRNFIYKWEDGKTFEGEKNEPTDHNSLTAPDVKVYSQPSLSMAQKWLREVKGINVRVNYLFDEQLWFADWIELGTRYYDSSDLHFRTYEEALSDGIDTVLYELTQDEE